MEVYKIFLVIRFSWLYGFRTITTPWKINMEPMNKGLEDDVPLQLDGNFCPNCFGVNE